jgi:NADH-quinone oxidoreductase subunit J
MTPTPQLIAFFVLAALAVGTGLGMLFSRNAVHSALFLVANFAIVAVFFLLLAAPFIAMVQVTVYAGAIMVLFLFVIMLLGAELLRSRGSALPWQPVLAGLLGVVFVGLAAFVVISRGVGAPPAPFASEVVANEFGGPQAVGLELYRNYLLPFELTSFLLLVAMIGAVVLTRDRRGRLVGSSPSKVSGPDPRG